MRTRMMCREMLGAFIVWALVSVSAATVNATEPLGVLQFDPLEPGMCVALEVPATENQAVGGLTWYNNDGDLVFPEVLVVAGYGGVAPNLAEAVVLLESVGGSEMGPSEVDFGQDVMSPTGVFYVIFRYPAFAGAQGPGQGPGIGYGLSDQESSVFVKAEGEDWVRMVTDKRLIVDPIYAAGGTTKSVAGDARPVLRLAPPMEASDSGDGADVATDENVPVRTEFTAPYPNPFNPEVTIAYALSEATDVTIAVYDVRGRLVKAIHAGVQPAGRYEEVWRGRDDAGLRQASGVYFIHLRAGTYERTRRVALLK